MKFGEALEMLYAGAKVTRGGWNGKGMWIALQHPDSLSQMRRPYIYMSPADGQFVPWVATQSDLLEDDWVTFRD
jgi:hypothetical protein